MTQKKGNAHRAKKGKKQATPSEIAKARHDNMQTASGVRDSSVTPGRAEPERTDAKPELTADEIKQHESQESLAAGEGMPQKQVFECFDCNETFDTAEARNKHEASSHPDDDDDLGLLDGDEDEGPEAA